ncbi:PilW family protein [Microbulbifer sp. SSSA008]|uniref:PilW family protein n=1 Tax=Microbulbifer sp. SSSA008 TaxID=3243380 RepID=UPI004039073F
MFNQRGISLVELMVSMTVGLVLMAGVSQLFLSSAVTFTTQQAMARVQETGRLAIDFISEDVRMAGYVGCMSVANVSDDGAFKNLLNNSETPLYNFALPAEGIDNDEINASYPSHSGESDVLLLRSANGTSVAASGYSASDRVYIENTGVEDDGCDEGKDEYSGICLEDIVVIADCTKARAFQVTGFEGDSTSERIGLLHSDADGFTPGNQKGEVTFDDDATERDNFFFSDAQVFVTTSTFYYIDNGISGRPSLFREINGESQELLTGVEKMQITYGLDADGDAVPEDYKAAKDVTDWGILTSIRVELLVSSDDDNVLEDTQLYTFNGEVDQNPGDKRLRQVFSSTMAIRNRMP